jgi:TonB family protein
MTTQSYQPQVNLTAVEPPARERWRLGGLVVLAILGALALVFMYYRWFGNVQPGNEASPSTSDTASEKAGHSSVSATQSRRASSRHRAETAAPPASDAQLTLLPGITQSAIRSPLAVEVISGGGQHQIITTRNDSIYLYDKTSASPNVTDTNAGYGTAAADPLLAKQQTLEGSVVLLARIDKDGKIQSLQPISGPEILFAAAREAVKGWRFNPYYTSGEAVETEAQITVKFAISAH